MKLVHHFMILLLLAGCASHPEYDEKVAKYLIEDAILELPADQLLGAPTLMERDAICETVIRTFVVDSAATQLIGFVSSDSDGIKLYDPPPQLLEHLSNNASHLVPLSNLSRLNQRDYDTHSRQSVMACYLHGMKMLSENQAEVVVEVVAVFFKPHGTFYRCCVSRQEGTWTMISKVVQRPLVIPA